MSVWLHEEKSTSRNNDGEHDASKQIVELPDDPKDRYQNLRIHSTGPYPTILRRPLQTKNFYSPAAAK